MAWTIVRMLPQRSARKFGVRQVRLSFFWLGCLVIAWGVLLLAAAVVAWAFYGALLLGDNESNYGFGEGSWGLICTSLPLVERPDVQHRRPRRCRRGGSGPEAPAESFSQPNRRRSSAFTRLGAA